jgi:hypothetical protein
MKLVPSAGGKTIIREKARRRRPVLTDEQNRRRRQFLWLFANEVGLYDPAIRRVRPHSTYEIAAFCNVSIRTVQLGIARARALRAELEDALDNRDLPEHAS